MLDKSAPHLFGKILVALLGGIWAENLDSHVGNADTWLDIQGKSLAHLAELALADNAPKLNLRAIELEKSRLLINGMCGIIHLHGGEVDLALLCSKRHLALHGEDCGGKSWHRTRKWY